MKVLLIHQNFPAQFRHLTKALTADARNDVVAIASDTAQAVAGVTLMRYALSPFDGAHTHAFARTFDLECRRAEQVLYACIALLGRGFRPDVVFVHSGWGESLSLRTTFPKAKIILYAEMFYRRTGLDVDFDPEFPAMSLDRLVGLHARNASTLLGLAECDVAISPTEWQKSTYPAEFRPKITVIHDGIDVDKARPDSRAAVRLSDGTVLTPGDPVVTFVSRDLEPLRGYHSFMRALPEVLRRHPRARVLIVGGDGASYGPKPDHGESWKAHFLKEVADRLDLSRVHFLGRLSYAAFLEVLQTSAVHVYLTYPFVLSWSLLEAMATGCCVVASATAPVREIVDGTNGMLVDFFAKDEIAAAILKALDNPDAFRPMREMARRRVLDGYDSRDCVAATLQLVQQISSRSEAAGLSGSTGRR